MKELSITMEIRFQIPNESLTLSGLIVSISDNLPDIGKALLVTLMKALELQATRQYLENAAGRTVRNGHESHERSFRTSFGKVSYRFAQLLDIATNRSFSPLRKMLSIDPYKRYQREALKAPINLAIHMSYQKAVAEYNAIVPAGISKSTLWRHLHRFSDQMNWRPDLKKIPYRFLMVDGTKVTLMNPSKQSIGLAQLRLALASTGIGDHFQPVGFWLNRSWDHIAADLRKRLDYNKLEVLFSDGEPGVKENLLASGMRHQRCQWHAKRDFRFILYMDGLKKAQQKSFVHQLNNIPALWLNAAALETIRPSDMNKVKELSEKTQQDFQDLTQMLDPLSYPKARAYVSNLADSVATFFHYWLQNKTWLPITTNAIESAFSRFTNRMKFIGKRWTEKGLIKWLQLSIHKLFFPDAWQNLWKQFLQINTAPKMFFLKTSFDWL
ncbi:MAG: hypothetical protein GXO76_02135 [Calditrichaeota bacterium]|nr:hypothetical protein [Calditrichota bacterium]